MKPLCYIHPLTNGGARLALNPTFLDPKKLPDCIFARPHWFISLLREGDQLLWNNEIKRWVIYRLVTLTQKPDVILGENIAAFNKESEGKLVKIKVIDGPGLSYREPGHWLLPELAQRDQTKGGTVPLTEALETIGRSLWNYDTARRDFSRRWNELMYEIAKDYETYIQRGRVTAVLGQGGASTGNKKRLPKKVILMNVKTGERVIKKIKRPIPTRRMPYV